MQDDDKEDEELMEILNEGNPDLENNDNGLLNRMEPE